MPSLSQNLIFKVVNGDSSYESVVVDYPNTGTSTFVYYSNPVKGEGYALSGDGIHTVSYTTSPHFHGTITMQATLATQPIERDWFDVKGTSVTYTPLDERTGNSVDIFNFIGNFVWVRGKIYIDEGTVSVIQYNY